GRRSGVLHAPRQGARLFRLGRVARGAHRSAAACAVLAVLGPCARQASWTKRRCIADLRQARRRSCRSVAELINYQLRLFRSDDVHLVGGSGPQDLDFGAFRPGDAVVVVGFMPYSTASVESARAAHRAGASLIAIADSLTAPMAEGADHLLLYESAFSPGFFPSLTGAIAIAQSLAAVTFSLGGAGAKKQLEATEARLAAMSRYVTEKG